MRVLAVAMAISLSFALAPASAEESGSSKTDKQAQSVPVQPDRTPQQSDQSRGQERARGERVQIERDWKAEEDANRTPTQHEESAGKPDKDHQTVGRDWRAHPERDENR
ncbi:hypothetical protein [Bradyrhizobium sp. STM 3561]|uniref:hypothetical protein n=1 Tax=Bradyrhizobium sp. STM 3561 TaxID=578923 RepID=UPI00388F6CE2